MPKESHEERLHREMIPNLMESLTELKTMVANGNTKESFVEAWCRGIVKRVLGFSATAGYNVVNQATHGKMRFDLVVTLSDNPDKILLVAEIKRLGSDLSKSDFRSGKTQLKEYALSIGTRWGILTNGCEWRLYDFQSDAISLREVVICEDVSNIDTSTKAVSDTAYDLAELSSYYIDKGLADFSAEAQALSGDSLAKAVLSTDIMKKIAKYLHSQKRQLKKTRQRGLNDAGADGADVPANAPSVVSPAVLATPGGPTLAVAGAIEQENKTE